MSLGFEFDEFTDSEPGLFLLEFIFYVFRVAVINWGIYFSTDDLTAGFDFWEYPSRKIEPLGSFVAAGSSI